MYVRKLNPARAPEGERMHPESPRRAKMTNSGLLENSKGSNGAKA